MYQASLYARSNAAQWDNVTRILGEWAGRLRWSGEEETVLDVGCGPGNVTVEMLLPRLPSSVRVLVGHDVSEEMVSHAAAAHAALAPRVRFLCTDIAARDLPATPLGACAEQLGGFSKVFSFYVLNWVPDQRTALRNVHDLLRPGGEALLLVATDSPIYDAFIAHQNNPRWSNYMEDIYNSIPPYKFSEDPVSDFSSALHQAGFHIHACPIKLNSYPFSTLQGLRDTLTTLIPPLRRVPEELKEQFMDDYMKEFQKAKAKFMSVEFNTKFEKSDTFIHNVHIIAHVEKMKDN